MRSLFAIAIILVILAAGWCGGWFWMAGWIDRNAPAVLTRIAERGVEVDCRDRTVVGFPFAMRVACAETAVAERQTGTQATLGRVTGGASVFAPTTARIDMASPVELVSPLLLEKPAEIRWRKAAVDIGVGMNGPRDVSFDAADLSTALALVNLPHPKLQAAHAAGTLAPSDDGGTAASVTFTDLNVSADGVDLPEMSGSASGSLSVPPKALLAGRAGIKLPVSAHAIDINIDSGGARFAATGDISLDATGVLDGTITLRIAGAKAFPALIAMLPPKLQKKGFAAIASAFAVGRPTTIDGEPGSEITVDIVHGEATVGGVSVKLPRVPL